MTTKAQIVQRVSATFARLGDLVYSAQLRRATDGVYNPATLSAASTETQTDGKLLFDENTIRQTNYLAGAEILPTDEVAYMQGVQFAPEKGDTVEITGVGTKSVVWSDDLLRLGALYLVVLR